MHTIWLRCIADFLHSIENISGSTSSRKRYEYNLRSFFGERNPDELTRRDVQAFLDAPSSSPRNRGKPVSPSTRNNRLMSLNSFYKYAASYEIDGSPIIHTIPPTLGFRYLKIGISPHALTADELRRFFTSIPNSTIKGLRDRALFLTFFWTGRRRSEIARLTWQDIEQAVIVEPDGTRRDGVIYRYVAKGHSREIQTAEMPSPAYHALIRYLEAASRLSTMQSTFPLFASLRPDQPNSRLTGGYCNSLFKSYCQRASLPSHYSLHSLRHTAARLRYMAGSSIQDIQVFLGHSSLATTDIYLKRLTGVADTGAKLLFDRFGNL